MKYNLYDFDGTIYDGDSGIDIMLFAMKKYPRIIIPSFWALFLYIIRFIDKVNFKSRIFSLLVSSLFISTFGKIFKVTLNLLPINLSHLFGFLSKTTIGKTGTLFFTA